jgi:arsenate reductase-like glutaredoxin family protein
MKDLKHIKRFNESEENLNISDVSNSVFSITEEQLDKLIEKVGDKITSTLDREGRSTKGLSIKNSVSDTIKSYLKKHCC